MLSDVWIEWCLSIPTMYVAVFIFCCFHFLNLGLASFSVVSFERSCDLETKDQFM